jgi:hypothetical protein
LTKQKVTTLTYQNQNMIDKEEGYAHNSRFGNKLADGSTISYNSLSAVVPADKYKLAFSCYLHLWFFNRLRLRADNYKIPGHRQALPLAVIF